MGYTTDFSGQFELDKPLSAPHKAYLEAFAQTRRMKRDAAKTALLSDPIRAAVSLPIGEEGGFYVGSTENYGQEETPDITDYNNEPKGQPGLWCQWAPSEDGTAIMWDGGEKFYAYVEWLEYLIANFLKPWGYSLNGRVRWSGEESDDTGVIRVTANVVESAEDVHSNPLKD